MFLAALVASQTIGITGSAAAWAALAGVATVVLVLGSAAIKLISKFTNLTTSVDRLNRNIEVITSQVGQHEHRISMLEGSEKSRSYREELPANPAALIYPVERK
jgi:hypothetical protein